MMFTAKGMDIIHFSRKPISSRATPLPVLFQVCQESRHETALLYTPLNGVDFHAIGGEKERINWVLDTIFCPESLLTFGQSVHPVHISLPQAHN
jgi:hypothetical protein